MSWLDYCNKYGMGFAMTDGTISVHFNDSVSLSLAPNKGCVTGSVRAKLTGQIV